MLRKLLTISTLVAALGCNNDRPRNCQEVQDSVDSGQKEKGARNKCNIPDDISLSLRYVSDGSSTTHVGSIKLNVNHDRNLSHVASIKVPDYLKVSCFVGGDAFIPSVIIENTAGVRQLRLSHFEHFDKDAKTLATRAANWPLLPGTTNVKKCQMGLANRDTTTYGHRSLIDQFGYTEVLGQEISFHKAPDHPAEIKRFWLNDQPVGSSYLKSITLANSRLGISLWGGSISGTKFEDILAEQKATAEESFILDAGQGLAYRTEADFAEPVLLGFKTNRGNYIANLRFNIAKAEILALVRESDFRSKILPVAAFGAFGLFLADNKLIMLTSNGQYYYNFDLSGSYSKKLVDARMLHGRILLMNDAKEIFVFDASDLLQPARDIAFNSTQSELAIEIKTAKLNSTNVNSLRDFWLDAFFQVWHFSKGSIEVFGAASQGLVSFSPKDGSVHLADPGKIKKVKAYNGSSLIVEKDSQHANQVSESFNHDNADDPAIEIVPHDGDSLTIKIGRENMLGLPQRRPQGGITTGNGRFSFAEHVLPVVKQSCSGSGCHSGGSPAASLALEDPNVFSENIGKILNSVGPSGSMPIGRRRLSHSEINRFILWRDKGFPR